MKLCYQEQRLNATLNSLSRTRRTKRQPTLTPKHEFPTERPTEQNKKGNNAEAIRTDPISLKPAQGHPFPIIHLVLNCRGITG